MQGTWNTHSGQRGTWRLEADVAKPAIFERDRHAEWESFEGTIKVPGVPDLDSPTPVSGWMTGKKMGFRVVGNERLGETVFVGKVRHDRVTGQFSTPDGYRGQWQGWWLVRGAEKLREDQ
jgi:hypothetical protein